MNRATVNRRKFVLPGGQYKNVDTRKTNQRRRRDARRFDLRGERTRNIYVNKPKQGYLNIIESFLWKYFLSLSKLYILKVDFFSNQNIT